jgi:zinc transporter ZupT
VDGFLFNKILDLYSIYLVTLLGSSYFLFYGLYFYPINLIKTRYDMKHTKNVLCFLLLIAFGTMILQAQETIPATGGNVVGSGGSVSHTVGQLLYNTVSGTNGTVAQGVQQPYEISVVT